MNQFSTHDLLAVLILGAVIAIIVTFYPEYRKNKKVEAESKRNHQKRIHSRNARREQPRQSNPPSIQPTPKTGSAVHQNSSSSNTNMMNFSDSSDSSCSSSSDSSSSSDCGSSSSFD